MPRDVKLQRMDLVDVEIELLDDRDNYERTTSMYVQNDTRAAIKICFLRATCRFDYLPDPYIMDTGVFVAGVDEANGASIAVDPWDAGGKNVPIAATAASGSVKLVYNGKEYDVTLKPYAETPDDGLYYPQLGWRLEEENTFTLDGEEVVIVRANPIRAGALSLPEGWENGNA